MENQFTLFGSIYLTALIAVIPLVWIFVSMLKFKVPVHIASLAALGISVVLAFAAWKMPALHTVEAALEGAALGFWPILWVVVAAIFTYNISVQSGAMDKIRAMLSGVTADRRIQGLILAFAFGGFLEAAAGFGTAVAIPVGILASLGFEPFFAAIVCLVANTVPVAFGAIGIPVITLSKLTDLPLGTLTIYIALQLLPFVLVLPIFLVFLTTGSIKGIRGVIPAALVSGAAFAVGQTAAAWFVGPELAAMVGSVLSLGMLVLWVKIFPVKKIWRFPGEEGIQVIKNSGGVKLTDGLKAWSPYIIMLLIILATRVVPELGFLSKPPFVLNILLFGGPGGKPSSFSLLTNPGTIILVSAILGGLIQGVSFAAMGRIALKTIRQILKTAATVLSIVAMARVMAYSGMIAAISTALSFITGSFFPLISPLIGAMGTFLTGSDTSANVLFGELQKQTAARIGAGQAWITAANASGATMGKMVSPQSISIATSATGLAGSEGKILSKTLKYSLVFVVILGILVYLLNLLFKPY